MFSTCILLGYLPTKMDEINLCPWLAKYLIAAMIFISVDSLLFVVPLF
jgi:hypothetical protein